MAPIPEDQPVDAPMEGRPEVGVEDIQQKVTAIEPKPKGKLKSGQRTIPSLGLICFTTSQIQGEQLMEWLKSLLGIHPVLADNEIAFNDSLPKSKDSSKARQLWFFHHLIKPFLFRNPGEQRWPMLLSEIQDSQPPRRKTLSSLQGGMDGTLQGYGWNPARVRGINPHKHFGDKFLLGFYLFF